MKISNVETFIAGNPWKNWLFVRVNTDEGIHGISESTINGFTKTAEAAIHELKPMYEGMDPFQVERISKRMFHDMYTDGGQVHKHAVSGIEVACWDIMGKSLGVPIYQMLGGKMRDRARAYANGWYRGPRTPESFHEKAKEVVKRGYTALKFDPFGAAYQITDLDDEALAVDIVAAVRDAVGPSVDVLVEGHCRFSTSTALRFARKMEPSNPTWFEEPTPHHKIDAMIEVAKESPVPIATGESLHTKYQFAELLKHDVIHILQPEPLACGGIWATRQICEMADAHYGVVAPHNAQGPVCTAICMQLAACTPNFFVQEIFDEFNVEWEKELTTGETFEVVDGYIHVSDAPGLGIDLNVEEIVKHPYDPSNFLPLFKDGWELREGDDAR
ncbi:mandelate racemase/muconate lactonizing enzyme family protein [Candidatus Latescibacterota bacterium]